jgi:thioester reductase-like protein
VTVAGVPSRTVFVTGGAGVVGAPLLSLLSRRHRVLALRRRRAVRRDVTDVPGDVTLPAFGIGDGRYQRLRDDVDVVVHSAAVTSFSVRGDHARVNVGGTREVLRFAADAGAPVVMVSTAFVGDDSSLVQAQCGYEASKREAERLVRASGIPAVIVRLSVVAGDSRTGEIVEPQGLHAVLAGVILGLVPVLPGESDKRIDFVPTDYVASALARLVEADPASWPDLLWLTQGRAAMRNDVFTQAAVDFAAGQDIFVEPVKFMPYERVERLFLPAFLSALPVRNQRYIQSMLRLARYINVTRTFPTAVDADGDWAGIGPPPRPDVVLERNLGFLWDQHVRRRSSAHG